MYNHKIYLKAVLYDLAKEKSERESAIKDLKEDGAEANSGEIDYQKAYIDALDYAQNIVKSYIHD